MTTEEMVDRVVEDHEGVIAPGPILLRKRIRGNIQRIVTKVDNHREWAFRRVIDTVTLVNFAAILPTNFLTFGKWGSVSLGPGVPPIREIALAEMNQLLQDFPTQGGPPRKWALASLDATTGQRIMACWPGDNLDLSITYIRTAPRVHDAADLDDITDDELHLIPAQWHDGPIYEGTVWMQMKDKANMQSVTEQKALYVEALADMVRTEQTLKGISHTIAPFGSRAMGGIA